MARRSILSILLTIYFAILAIFWGLLPYSVHCSVMSNIGIKECPSNIIHVAMGIIFFIVAIYIRQGNFFKSENWD